MVDKISREQYEELCESKFWDSDDDFHRMLEEITGITAKRYTGYQYFDSYDNYVVKGKTSRGTKSAITRALKKMHTDINLRQQQEEEMMMNELKPENAFRIKKDF